jgi:ankyrin repeat protein
MFESLAIAIEFRSLEAAAGIVSADPSVVLAKDENGQTALHLAVDSFKQGKPDSDTDLLAIVDLLVSNGSDTNARNRDGKTPHALAVETGYGELAGRLPNAPQDGEVS